MNGTINYTSAEDLLQMRNKQVRELREQIAEMQLLLDKANAQLQKGHVANVMSGQILYEALHCPCKFESASYTISVHATKSGAEKRIREHKLQEYKEWRSLWEVDKFARLHKQIKQGNPIYSDEYNKLKETIQDMKFGWDMSWAVLEIILQE